MEPLALIRLQLELEGIGVEDDELLVRRPGPNPDVIYRFAIYRYVGGYARFFRHDLLAEPRERLAALSPEAALYGTQKVTGILEEVAPCREIFRGKSYIFPETVTPTDYPDAVPGHALRESGLPGLPVTGRSLYAVTVDGQVVSTCESVRENEKAAEAWVQTLSTYRRRGYARQVTLAWAHDLMKRGKVPFYSHKIENQASERLAYSLTLTRFATVVGYL